ncbi:MAG: diguanylate cyclase [gamma proteobacterium endosymbiont of Lamellibrachia anaximandri]|nr:diguanylate cyclase [gamma proteobacterium endosymbiont of Lamellibrachia anaximandri]
MQPSLSKVLIVEDSRAISMILQAQLQDEWAIPSEVADSRARAKALLADNPERFFVAVLDLNLPDATDGEVVGLVQGFGIPAIVLTGNLDGALRDRMVKSNLVDYVLKRNASEIEYVTHLVAQLRENHQRKVLVVDDSPSFRLYLKELLKIHRYQLIEADNGKAALDLIRENRDIVLVITDYNMPIMDGAKLIENIRQQHGREDMAIIGMSDGSNNRLTSRLLKAGANDFITKPFEVEEFYCRVIQSVDMILRVRHIRDSATRDFLTGVYNRRYLFELGEKVYAAAKQDGQSLVAAMIDADYFKRINDTYGHQMGDRALIALAGVLRESTKETDLVARYGGEEFVALVHCKDEEEARHCLERVRQSVENAEIPMDDGEVLKLTVSIGGTTNFCESLDKMLDLADEGVYAAKERGRNQVVMV